VRCCARDIGMRTAKHDVEQLLNKLPDDCSVEDIQYHFYVLDKVRRGLEDARVNGRRYKRIATPVEDARSTLWHGIAKTPSLQEAPKSPTVAHSFANCANEMGHL
jgi:hypothetical protein